MLILDRIVGWSNSQPWGCRHLSHIIYSWRSRRLPSGQMSLLISKLAWVHSKESMITTSLKLYSPLCCAVLGSSYSRAGMALGYLPRVPVALTRMELAIHPDGILRGLNQPSVCRVVTNLINTRYIKWKQNLLITLQIYKQTPQHKCCLWKVCLDQRSYPIHHDFL